MHIHFKTDVTLRVSFAWRDGTPAPIPAGDITMMLRTASMGPAITAVYSGDGGALRRDGNAILLPLPGGSLPPGDLSLTVSFAMPDPDDVERQRKLCDIWSTGITLSRAHSCFIAPDSVNVVITLPADAPASGSPVEPDGSDIATEADVDGAIAEAFASLCAPIVP